MEEKGEVRSEREMRVEGEEYDAERAKGEEQNVRRL